MTTDLYTAKEKSAVREKLLKEQGGCCAITKQPLPLSQSVTDHAHDSELLVRGVLSRQSNSLLGVIENGWKRYLGWWFSGSISEFLRQCADYLEREPDKRYRHDAWLKRVQIDFSSLNESSKKDVLQYMNQPQGANATERKKFFKNALMTRQFTFEEIKNLIKEKKG